jgi:hypothetical protein
VEIADQVARWLIARLTGLPDLAEAVLTLPLLVLVTFIALVVLTRQVLPRLGDLVVDWLVPAASFLLTVLLLTVEFAATQPFRWAGATPPAALYGLGNGAVTFDDAIRGLSRVLVGPIWRISRVWKVLLFAAAVYGIYRWGLGYCDRNPSNGCTAPNEAWLASVRDAYDKLRG